MTEKPTDRTQAIEAAGRILAYVGTRSGKAPKPEPRDCEVAATALLEAASALDYVENQRAIAERERDALRQRCDRLEKTIEGLRLPDAVRRQASGTELHAANREAKNLRERLRKAEAEAAKILVEAAALAHAASAFLDAVKANENAATYKTPPAAQEP